MFGKKTYEQNLKEVKETNILRRVVRTEEVTLVNVVR